MQISLQGLMNLNLIQVVQKHENMKVYFRSLLIRSGWFLALCVINSSTKYVMSGPIDELWHSFILFTKIYHQFCYLVAGHYIHRDLVHQSVPNDKPNDFGGYMQLLQDYKVLFDEDGNGYGFAAQGFLRHRDCRMG
jgi:hypothetical protein